MTKAPGSLPETPDLSAWKEIELPPHWSDKLPKMVGDFQYIDKALGRRLAIFQYEQEIDEIIEEDKNGEQNDE